jgi:putative transcriptional regulator
MKDVHVKVDQNDLSSFRTGRVDTDRVDATTDNDIQEQIEHDNAEAIVDMGEYIRGVRARVGAHGLVRHRVWNCSTKSDSL